MELQRIEPQAPCVQRPLRQQIPGLGQGPIRTEADIRRLAAVIEHVEQLARPERQAAALDPPLVGSNQRGKTLSAEHVVNLIP